MDKKMFFILSISIIVFSVIISFIVFSIIFYFPIHAQSEISLNYRSLRASSDENQVRSIAIAVPLKDLDSEFIEVRLQDSFLAESSGENLDPERLSILTLNKTYHLKDRNIKIPVDDLTEHENKQKVLLETTITVKPDDYPGEYYNKLIISQTNSEGELSEKEFPVQFTVEPWLELEFDSHFHKISEVDYRENNLESTIPGRIKISGNVPWRLFVKGDKSKMTFDSNILFRATSENDSVELLNENINIKDKKIAIASSNVKTGKPSEPLVITFDMLIKDFRRIKAGIQELPISFELEPLRFN